MIALPLAARSTNPIWGFVCIPLEPAPGVLALTAFVFHVCFLMS
jgi:hypothetical protein